MGRRRRRRNKRKRPIDFQEAILEVLEKVGKSTPRNSVAWVAARKRFEELFQKDPEKFIETVKALLERAIRYTEEVIPKQKNRLESGLELFYLWEMVGNIFRLLQETNISDKAIIDVLRRIEAKGIVPPAHPARNDLGDYLVWTIIP